MIKRSKLELTWYNKGKALIPLDEGKYGYAWVEPTDPRYCQTRPLVFDKHFTAQQENKDDSTTYSERADFLPQDDNLLILGESGDVLEALTRSPEISDKYIGQVKCIYIDPPFNTAQSFASYEDNLEHSVWLTMMRDRLLNMRTLLSDNGLIWVHLDDVENHRMKLLLDEIFGVENFVAEFIWQKRTSKSNDADISISHDTIICFAKDRGKIRKTLNKIPLKAEFKNLDDDPRGPWKTAPFAAPGHRPNMEYPITLPSGRVITPPVGRCWPRPLEGYEALLKDGRIWFGPKGDAAPQIKRFQSEIDSVVVPDTFWKADELGSTTTAKREIQALFPGTDPFSTPKPERLLERIIHIATDPGDIVLDCFAGSGTTAAVAQKMGRRWVTCELVEDTFHRFTKPRLEKVINNEDYGGITLTKGKRVDATKTGLPERLNPEDAQKLTSLLNKALQDEPELKINPAIKAVKNLVKTKKSKDTVNWRGGGGFTIAHLAPECFDYDPELRLTFLTEAAEGETLVRCIAANLGFYISSGDSYFDGHYNRKRLAVVEGLVDKAKVDEALSHLPEGCSVDIAATMVDEDVRDYLSSFENGSRIIHIPFGVFPNAPSNPDEDEKVEIVEPISIADSREDR
ncbi:site-specific DNA-methyltransferase [Corynebacterium sp. KPL3927]|uniref:site-specific DNA-methyltransferase n=1 Tax=Corynebacterium sp. KPL3927 TaxID=3158324 RepID=UPI0032EC8A2A